MTPLRRQSVFLDLIQATFLLLVMLAMLVTGTSTIPFDGLVAFISFVTLCALFVLIFQFQRSVVPVKIVRSRISINSRKHRSQVNDPLIL